MHHNKILYIPQGYAPLGKYQNQLARLAAEMLWRTSTTAERREHGHWIDVHHTFWEAMFGSSKYYRVLREARESGLIEVRMNKEGTGDSYSCGRYAKGYRLASKFRTGEFEPYELTGVVRARLEHGRVFSGELLGDAGQALFERMPWVSLGKIADEDFGKSKCESQWAKYAVQQIQAKRFHANRCRFGRFHSSHTALPRRIRKHLLDPSANPLVTIDISSCQPLILGLLSAQQIAYPSHPFTNSTDQGETRGITGRGQHRIPLCSSLRAKRTEAISEFLELCEAGQLYEFITERLRSGDIDVKPRMVTAEINGVLRTWTDRPAEATREKVKGSIIVCLFCDLQMMQEMSVFQVIERYWPPVANYLIATKSTCGYQQVAKDCQRIESTLMIDTVAAEYMRRHPERAIVTIHDELMVPSDLVDVAKELIREAFAPFGVRPHTK